MVLPTTSSISISQIIVEFGPSHNKLSSMYNIATGVPSSGKISLSDLRGKAKMTVTYTFTNAGQSGPNGPTLSQLQSAYAGNTTMSGVLLYNSIQGYQLITVSNSGTYAFTVAGATGASSAVANTGAGGKGGLLNFSYSLVTGDQLIVCVGQTTPVYSFRNGGGGGGGGAGASYVVLNRASALTLLAVAGGGGGGAALISGISVSITQNEPTASVLAGASHYTIGSSYAASAGAGCAKDWLDGLIGSAGGGSFGGGGAGSYWGGGGGGGGYNGAVGGGAGTNFVTNSITSYTAANNTSSINGDVTITG